MQVPARAENLLDYGKGRISYYYGPINVVFSAILMTIRELYLKAN